MAGDPLQHRAHADLITQRAADQLRELLEELVQEIDPFPSFPGSMFSYGIEMEGVAGSDPERGCVILAEDGKFYELTVGMDMEALAAGGDHVATRSEQRIPLDDLPPAEYVAYAHAAIASAVEHLLREAERSSGAGA